MLFGGGSKTRKNQSCLFYFSFEFSWLSESMELTALGSKEIWGEIGPHVDYRQ